ncbi:unnamed protein product, partial [Onchocerca flexuosa]|uniref:30S ribosomal protein S20 n=1 Tax=Onchocerca flexuosa TaxID=387005 RepID=A0A183I830_9BILA
MFRYEFLYLATAVICRFERRHYVPLCDFLLFTLLYLKMRRKISTHLVRERIGQTEKNIAQGREKCRRKMDAFIKKKDARNIISNQLRSKAARIQAIESDKPDLNIAAQKFQKAKNRIITQSFERVEKIAKLMERRKLSIHNALFATLSAKKASKE